MKGSHKWELKDSIIEKGPEDTLANWLSLRKNTQDELILQEKKLVLTLSWSHCICAWGGGGVGGRAPCLEALAKESVHTTDTRNQRQGGEKWTGVVTSPSKECPR